MCIRDRVVTVVHADEDVSGVLNAWGENGFVDVGERVRVTMPGSALKPRCVIGESVSERTQLQRITTHHHVSITVRRRFVFNTRLTARALDNNLSRVLIPVSYTHLRAHETPE